MLDELRAVVESLTPGQRATLVELLGARGASKADEPIAIVGMAGRFPGARNLEEFWNLLVEGRDAIVEVPPERWKADAFYHPDRTAPGKMATRWGGFLDDIDLFDAEFFGITPREAAAMDPQQRVFLETAWEALEDAGLPASSLANTPTGVFVGVSNFDYMWHQFSHLDRIDAYASSGAAHCIVANRLSYLLNLTGPSVAVDAACASSLVAVHLACQSLRSGECGTAVAGGVNLVLTPHLCVSLSAWGMMSADGRCKTFDARADGFVRGEGSGVVVLRRLVDAEAAGDRVLAVIRGSAVNQDGKTNGLTAPNGIAQQAVIRQALVRAGLSPAQVSFLETHGTGTSLGDPIEVEAINEIFGSRVERCMLGAVKTNIGHLEPAAGIAGLIKVVLALRHGVIPRNLHYQALNPHLVLAPGIELASTAVAWHPGSTPRFAGVSSFSFGGTNAHVVLGEAPSGELAARAALPRAAGPTIVPLSARSEEARRAMAARHAELLDRASPELTVEAVAALRAHHRDHLDLRLAVVASDRASTAEALRSFAEGRPHPDVLHGRRQAQPRLGFLFTGQGSQWRGMGRELMRTEPVFRDAVLEADAVFQRVARQSYAGVFDGDDAPDGSLDRTDVAQPAIFLLQLALTRMLAHWGIRPDAVAGHSVGEIAAAWAAGILGLDDAVRVVHHRSRLMQRATGRGGMASVALSPLEVRPYLEHHRGLALAAHNGPRSVVISGDPAALDDALRELAAGGVRCKRLAVDYAFHSPQMDPLRDELAGALAGMAPNPPRIAFYSTVTGRRELALAGPAHWVRNMRDPVAFAEVVERLVSDGTNLFLEVGPHPALTPHVAEALDEGRGQAPTAYCMRRATDDRHGLLAAAATLYVQGIDPDWSRLTGAPDRRWSLPGYPWQRQRHWLEASELASAALGPAQPRTSALLYRTAWTADEAPPVAGAQPKRGYLMFSDGSALADELRDAIQAAGARCWLVTLGDAVVLGGDRCVLDPENRDHLDRLFHHLEAAAFEVDQILLLFTSTGADPTVTDGGWYGAAVRPVHVLRCLAQSLITAQRSAELAVITRTAVNAGGDHAVSPAHAALWGFGRALALESPDLSLLLLDVPALRDPAEARHVLARLAAPASEHQSAWRHGQWWVPRLTAYEPVRQPDEAPCDGSGTYLITGGLGSLGLATARRLIRHGVKTLALVGRRPPTPQQQQEIARLEQEGAQVITLQADVSEIAEARRVLETIALLAPPLRGVIHAAGVVEDGLVARATAPSFDRVLRPKVAGGWNLHQLTLSMELDQFVLFSSATATLGAAGQTSYAAANAFLDGLAEHRRTLGHRALCVHWGAWRDSTMVSDQVASRLKRFGFDAMSPDTALDALEQVPHDDATAPTVLAADWTRFVEQVENPGLARFLERVLRTSRSTPERKVRASLATSPANQRLKLLYSHIRSVVLSTMAMDPRTTVRPDQGLVELGIDSLLAVHIAIRLSGDLDCRLPKTLVYDHPTLQSLTEHLLGVVFPEATLDPVRVRPRGAGDGIPIDRSAHDAIANASADTIQSLLDEELAGLVPPS